MTPRKEPVITDPMRNRLLPRKTGAVFGIALGTIFHLSGLLDSRIRPTPGTEHPPLEGEMAVPCTECHSDLIAGAIVHPPAEAEECEACHELTPAEDEWSVTLVMPEEELCLMCHDNPSEVEDAVSRHPPAEEGACPWCHNPHSSSREFLFREEGNGICVDCHVEQEEELERPHVHGVIQKLGCPSCHNPHASPNRRLLHREGVDLCIECHLGTSQDHPLDDRGKVVLFGSRTVETLFFDQLPKLQLPGDLLIGHPVAKHPVQGDQNPRRPEEAFWCGSCHEPHGSFRQNLLIGGEGLGLCRQCHQK